MSRVPGTEINTLTFHVDTSRANYPSVRLLIDGEDLLATTGMDEGNDPAHLFDTGALLPNKPPRRIAFYGCGCGEFGCGNVAGLITRGAGTIEWSDFRSVTGWYGAALPEPEAGPDSVANAEEWLEPSSRQDLPTLRFDAIDYLAVVHAAMSDRSWETRTRAVVRHARALDPEISIWAFRDGDGVTVHERVAGVYRSTNLRLPEGDPDALAARLVALLRRGADPRRIAAQKLWK